MSTQEHARWLKYAAVCNSSTSTGEARRTAFDRWWQPIKTECLAKPTSDKRKAAKALSG